MLGAHELSSVLGAVTPDTNKNPDAVRAFAREATKLGLSLLLVFPKSKEPMDMRTTVTKNKDNAAAQEAAREAGRSDWSKVKSPAGLALASSDYKVVGKYIDEAYRKLGTWVNDAGEKVDKVAVKDMKTLTLTDPPELNFAIELGESRIVVVDCDTAEQKARFLQWAQAPADLPPTVRTPGQIGLDGTMVHSDGGHYYFTVPEGVELPDNIGAITMSGDDGFSILWHRRYVLIPPSTRKEGAYELVGDPYSLSDCEPLLVEIRKAGELRAARTAAFEESQRQRKEAAENGSDPGMDQIIADWAESVSWTNILEPLGWTPASRNDACGCEVWTAGPGHASPKSATAHDNGCTLGRYTPDAPLHIWTDNPGEPFNSWIAKHGTSTMSKLQVVALTEFKGNMGKAVDTLGLAPAATTMDASGNVQNMDGVAIAAGVDVSSLDKPLDFSNMEDGDDEPAPAKASTAPPAWGASIATDGSYHISVPSEQVITIVDPETGALTDLSELDEFYESPAKLNIKCAGCDEIFGKQYIRENNGSEFQQDADGDWWHAEHDPDDGVITGGHLMVDDDAAGWSTDEAGMDQAAEATPSVADQFTTPGGDAAPEEHTTPFADTAEDPDPDFLNSPISGVPMMAPFAHWRDMPPPEFIIEDLIENGGLSCLIGAPGVGKSSVALDMACHIATGKSWQGRKTLQTKVLYMPGEGLSGAVQRIASWEEAHKTEVGRNLILADSIVKLGAPNEVWQEVIKHIMRQGIGFIIFDTFARMALAVEENSATEVGKAVERFDQIRKNARVGVMVVHHTGKHSETARGSSALNGALDSELLVRNGRWSTAELEDSKTGKLPGKPLEVETTKQKNAEQLEEPLPLMMVNWVDRNAPLITGPNGNIDPMQGEISMARPTPETTVETAIRIAKLIRDRFSTQGLTRAEVVGYLQPDPHTAGRKDAAKAWKQKVGEAIDLGLKYELIETLTGTASGQRYVGSTGTFEAARDQFAASMVTE